MPRKEKSLQSKFRFNPSSHTSLGEQLLGWSQQELEKIETGDDLSEDEIIRLRKIRERGLKKVS